MHPVVLSLAPLSVRCSVGYCAVDDVNAELLAGHLKNNTHLTELR